MAKNLENQDLANPGFTRDSASNERRSSKEDKGGLSKRELHNLRKLEKLDKKDNLK